MKQKRQRLGRYRFVSFLGRGDGGDVYLGEHLSLKQKAAIKVLSTRLDEHVLERFFASGKLTHPHIVRVYDGGTEGDLSYLVMEYFPLGSLRMYHPRGSHVPPSTVASYVQQIASTLDCVHTHGFLHRNLKPENLFLNQENQLLLSDFSMHFPFRSYSQQPLQAAYKAPEQFSGKPETSSDQYTLALLAYEWLGGELPFPDTRDARSEPSSAVAVASLREKVPDLPPAVEAVLFRALAHDAHARFAHIREFAKAFVQACHPHHIISLPTNGSNDTANQRDAPSLENHTALSAQKTIHMVPVPVTALIGRQSERETVTSMLARSEVRLLTLTGPGGVGKTRLALACADDLRSVFRDGTYFLSLAALTHPDQVIPTLLQTLGIKEHPDCSSIASLRHALYEKHLLLVLDNMEHVVDAAPCLLEMLRCCPALKLLVTSRARLHITGEHVFSLPPLMRPHPKEVKSSHLVENACIALFVERARQVQPDFQITMDNAPALVELTNLLEGIPLAIELAAARMSMLSPLQLLARFPRRLDLLAPPGRSDSSRQQTIRQTIRWSYNLLPPAEKQLLCRLSVFVDGCHLSDIEALYRHLQEDVYQVLDGVGSLLDKSLMFQQAHDQTEPRLDLLETVREFGREVLAANGELDRVRAAHARYYASLVPSPEPAQIGLAQGAWLLQVKQEYQNLRAALHFFQEKEDGEQALRLAVGIGGIWFVNGYGHEGEDHLKELLAQRASSVTSISPETEVLALALAARSIMGNLDMVLSKALLVEAKQRCRAITDLRYLGIVESLLAFLEWNLGHTDEADALYQEHVAMMRQLGDQRALARALLSQSFTWLSRGAFERARMGAQEAVHIARALDEHWVLASALHFSGWSAFCQGDWTQALLLEEESVARLRVLQFPTFGLEALGTLASIMAALGDHEKAGMLFEEVCTRGQEAGNAPEWARGLNGLGYLALLRQNVKEARQLFEKSGQVLLQSKTLAAYSAHILAGSLEGRAATASREGQFIPATRLLGEAEAVRSVGPYITLLSRDVGSWEQTRETCIHTLGLSRFTEVFLEGRKGATHHACVSQILATRQQAQSVDSTPGDRRGSSLVPADQTRQAHPKTLPSGEHLTRRELDVLRLLAQGYSNAEIAARLVLGVVTINAHLRSIYSKMGVSSRLRAVRYAQDHHVLVEP